MTGAAPAEKSPADFHEEALPHMDAVYRFALRLSGTADQAEEQDAQGMITSFFHRLRRLLGGKTPPVSPGEGMGEPKGASEPISCMEAPEKVHEYLDGELGTVSHEAVAAHFAVCKAYYPHLKLEERFRGLLRRSAVGEETARQKTRRVRRGENDE